MERTPTRRWGSLTPTQKRAIIAGFIVTGIWQLVMLIDLWRRPADRIRGSKRAWVAASFVRPFGQIAYYMFGRRSPTHSSVQPGVGAGGASSSRQASRPTVERSR